MATVPIKALTQQSQAGLFTTLPSLSNAPAPPQLPTGTVSLYRDSASDGNAWAGAKLDIRTSDYVPNVRHRLDSAMLDNCDYLAFNLPPGTVMTLMDDVIPVSAGENVADLKRTGYSVDLVGVGYTLSVDIRQYGMGDVIASFMWRTVDLTRGAIELYFDPRFTGIRQIIFLAEFEPGVIHDLAEWAIEDDLSSVCWRTMVDRQTAALFAERDGSGASFNNISGSVAMKEVPDLSQFGFDDCISSFRWDTVNPAKEVIEPFDIAATSSSNSGALSSITTGINRSSLPQTVKISLRNSTSQTITVSTQDQFVTGVSTTVTLSETVKEGVGVASSETTATWSITLNFQYTQTTTNTTSTTKTVDLNIEQEVQAPPNTSYTAKLLVKIGQLPPTTYKTTATRWYTVPMAGAERDPANNYWYKRTEPIEVSMTGALAVSSWTEIDTTPLPIDDKAAASQ
ncbi:hypothetical protein F4860DRAFT_492202 [Xylaria cubensis]|nr:hypothetical protein F4860DRAFT_492202 [Xylaria cubensis]